MHLVKQKYNKDIINCRGQSIIELIIAMAIFSLIGAAMIVMVVGSFTALVQGGEHTQAKALAQEGIEAVRAIKDRAWNENIYSTSSISVSSGQWVFDGEGTTETIGQFTRTISFDNVCRDSSDDITDCPGDYIDVHSKKATVSISWEIRPGVTNLVQRIAYLTNWDSQEWTQTNWSTGAGQAVWSDVTKYDSDDGNIDISSTGQVELVCAGTQDSDFSLPTGISYDWLFTTAENYTYDSDKIEVTAGYARLKVSGGATSSENTLNEEFTSNADNWTFSMWDAGGGEVDPTGAFQGSGGNPGGYINIDIPSNAKGDELGGYWEQSINVTENSAQVTCYFDWKITQWVAPDAVDDYQFYVFLDNTTGEPTIGSEIWSSGIQNSITSWSGQQTIDCSSQAATSGTYYYKIAVWLDTKNKNTGPITAGYDNAKVHWEKATGGSYVTDTPSIYPVNSYSVPGVQSWDSFTETSSKDGGEIYYQLSNDDGSVWQYWSGATWATVSGATDYNTVSVINTNISNFSTVGEQIKFKAFLQSNGSQFVQLDNINIGFTASDPVWIFSAWDVDGGEVAPNGNFQLIGGNPNSYVDIVVPQGGGDEVGGYWEQSFTTVVDNPSNVSVNFDYKVIDFNDLPNVAEIRMYIDTASGDPTTQIGSPVTLSAEGSWTSNTAVDIGSAITTAGVYYLKIAFWVETPSGGGPGGIGPFTIGYDNVSVGLGNGTCPTSGYLISSAFDMSDSSPVQIIEWDETLPSGSDIKFQIRAAVTQAGLASEAWSSYFNTAKGELISTDYNSNIWVQYKASLTGNGNDTPVLEEIRINYK